MKLLQFSTRSCQEGKRRTCCAAGCGTLARPQSTFCIRHGDPTQQPLCSHESCTAMGRRKGTTGTWYCLKHMKLLQLSTSLYRRTCSASGCSTFARPQSTFCVRHGGPIQRTLCSHESCTAMGRIKLSSGAWFCRKHMKLLQSSTSPCHQAKRRTTARRTNTELEEDPHLPDVPEPPDPLRSAAACAFRQPLRMNRVSNEAFLTAMDLALPSSSER